MFCFFPGTVYFNAAHGCLKCTCVGVHLNSEHKMIFESVDAELRTDVGFKQRVDKDHHKPWRSPLEKLKNFNMIDGVPYEGLHQFDRGVTLKLVLGLYEGIFENFEKWSPRQKEAVNTFLIKTRLPSEVNRPMRSFRYRHFWKATEFRSFLLHISIAVLKDFMSFDAFNHFLCYFCSVTIFNSTAHKHLWPLAEKFLYYFVKNFPQYYGRAHMTSNVHNLLHVSGDVYMFGAVPEYSAYRYENYLQIVRRYVRSGTHVVTQVAGRMQEIASVQVATNRVTQTYPRLKGNGAGIHVTADFVLLPNFKDQWFLTTENGIIKFLEAKRISSLLYTVIGIQYETWTEQFSASVDGEQLSSTDLHIYKIDENGPSRSVEIPHYAIKCKFVALRLPSTSFKHPDPQLSSSLISLTPLLHTFQ
ncbi:uncharacterized protein LOC133391065 [Anopheles gambiae]|uniref:uncharacterized protein LOC133391065 n=1 Tax=Anopheles gambiae TaxID=7165 RepID=UPI002AC9A09C|nr:uncharacterized protein LOC133391065 [Anopheles gambiae]